MSPVRLGGCGLLEGTVASLARGTSKLEVKFQGRLLMNQQSIRSYFPVCCLVLCISGLLTPSVLSAQQAKAGVLSADEIKQVVPAAYFFRGQSAPVQLRNSAGFRVPGGKLVLAGLVDTGGYASDVQTKYQGFLITEVKVNIEGSELEPGEYGFGFSKDGKFLVLDVGANDLFSVAAHVDAELRRPTPLKIVEDAGGYRLYDGRMWVSLKAE
jgi:hypothetical protein